LEAILVTGDEIVRMAERHVGEKYVLGTRVPKDNGAWKGPWDCAEFASWIVYQATGKLFGCGENPASPGVADAYTGFWARDAKRFDCAITVEDAMRIPGAFVLRGSKKSQLGHIVISDGKGGTIEAHSAKLGVVRNKLAGRPWDMGILPPMICYKTEPLLAVPPQVTRDEAPASNLM
jgi:N-acetylmuramoyl-L-alanine amidase